MTYPYTELSFTLRLLTSTLDTLESTPTIVLVLVSSPGKSCSSEKHRNKLLFLTLRLPIKSLIFTRDSEQFVLVFGYGIMNYMNY